MVPPRFEEVQKEIPDLFSGDESKVKAIQDDFRTILSDVGYTNDEINGMSDPRTLLLLKKVSEGNVLAQRVEKAKERKANKANVVSKPTKSSKRTGKTTRKPDNDSNKNYESAREQVLSLSLIHISEPTD